MKTIKKSVSVILAVCLLCGCFITAFASDDFTYTETDGEITVTGYTGTAAALTIPAEIDGKPVTAVQQEAFKNFGIESVVIPQTVVTIGAYAFAGCANLTNVEFAHNGALESIEASAFQSCTALESTVIPAGVKTVNQYAFAYCSALTSVEFAQNSSLDNIGASAFQYCTALKNFVLPDGTKTVGRSVFSNTKLENLTIPASVTAFYDTSIVTEIGSPTNPNDEYILIYYGGTAAQWSELVENSKPYADLSVFKNLLWSVDSKPYVNIYLKPGIIINKPADPAKEHYTFKGWTQQGSSAVVEDFGTMPDANVRFNAKFIPVNYFATFIVDGKEYKKVAFTVETASLNEPAVPEKEGYTGSWEPYELKPENITINAVYTINSYTIKFVYEGKEKEQTLEYGSPVTAPEVETREGYDFVWTPEVPATMPAKDLTCTGEYVKQVYQAILIADGKQTGSIPYTYGQKSVQLPDVPEKEGYTGKWLPYSLPVGGTEIYAKYTVNTYTATFIVDGKETVYNIKFGSAVKAPAVQAPQGYKLVWSPTVPATMPAKDITVNGSFVCVSKVSILKNTGKRSVDYGYSLVLYANASDLPDGAKLVWSIPGGKDEQGGEYSTGALKENTTVTLKLVGKDNKIIKDADGKEIKDTEEITVNGGFFKIIVWFFKNLFRADMTVYQK